jgi:NTP pyrophosphatase (non-canonical NTP hydrolase)
MDLNQYQNLSCRTRNPDLDFLGNLNQSGFGLAGESGEVVDEIKKVIFHGHFADRDRFKKELGDVLWYLTDIATTLGLTLSEIAEHNIEKLEKRYPNGFSSEDSINREEYTWEE